MLSFSLVFISLQVVVLVVAVLSLVSNTSKLTKLNIMHNSQPNSSDSLAYSNNSC